MPLNVRRICTSVLLVLFSFITYSQAQQTGTPTSGDVMRERISKAKAYIAVRNYSAAIYELENIRKESNDTALQGGVYVLLMNCHLEQGDSRIVVCGPSIRTLSRRPREPRIPTASA